MVEVYIDRFIHFMEGSEIDNAHLGITWLFHTWIMNETRTRKKKKTKDMSNILSYKIRLGSRTFFQWMSVFYPML